MYLKRRRRRVLVNVRPICELLSQTAGLDDIHEGLTLALRKQASSFPRMTMPLKISPIPRRLSFCQSHARENKISYGP